MWLLLSILQNSLPQGLEHSSTISIFKLARSLVSSLLRSLVKFFFHSKINFICSRHRVISFVYIIILYSNIYSYNKKTLSFNAIFKTKKTERVLHTCSTSIHLKTQMRTNKPGLRNYSDKSCFEGRVDNHCFETIFLIPHERIEHLIVCKTNYSQFNQK